MKREKPYHDSTRGLWHFLSTKKEDIMKHFFSFIAVFALGLLAGSHTALGAVDTGDEGKSPYGLHHMAGNIGEWVQDWFGFDYYAYIPERNPAGPTSGRYKVVRGGSWKSKPNMLRSATRGGAAPDQRSPTIGFRCAGSVPLS